MNQSEITKWTRRGIRELVPKDIKDTDIALMTLQGVNYLGMKIKNIEPSFYQIRKAVQSSTFIFDKPSDCIAVLYVWDLGTTCGTVSGAADNGSGEIRITASADHDLSDEDIITVQDVGGCTEANDTWVIDYDTSTHATTEFDLTGSTFTNTYTSGGIYFAPPQNPTRIPRLNLDKASLAHETCWYPRGNHIIIDQKDFENDILIDYIASPDAITDIPAEYHMGLVAWNVINLMVLPENNQNNALEFQDKLAALKKYQQILALIEDRIDETFRVSHEPVEIVDEDFYESEMEG